MTQRYAAEEVIISEPGGFNSRRLSVLSPRASWEVSAPGDFSAFASMDDLRDAGFGHELKGRWLTWTSPLGAWGGVISGRPISDGIAEISAEGWAVLMRDRVIDEWNFPPSGAAAGLARRAIESGRISGDIPLTFGEVTEDGLSVDVALGGQDVFTDALPQLVDEGGIEWIVDADRVFHVGTILGDDDTASVRLSEGRHIIPPYRIADDTWATAPTTLKRIMPPRGGDGGNARPGTSLSAATAQPQIIDYGSNTTQRGGPGGGPAGSAAVAGTVPEKVTLVYGNDFQLPRLLTTPIEFDVLDVEHIFRKLTLGHTIRVELGTFAGSFRIMAMAIDADSGIASLAGEGSADA